MINNDKATADIGPVVANTGAILASEIANSDFLNIGLCKTWPNEIFRSDDYQSGRDDG